MPLESFRFVHAGDVRLDEQLQDITEVAEGERALLQDATLTSFQNLIADCQALEIDFLLLTGQVFSEDGATLRACIALRNSIETLSQHGIITVIVPDDDVHFQNEVTTRFFQGDSVAVLSPWKAEQEISNHNSKPIARIARLTHEETAALFQEKSTLPLWGEFPLFQIAIASTKELQKNCYHGSTKATRAKTKSNSLRDNLPFDLLVTHQFSPAQHSVQQTDEETAKDRSQPSHQIIDWGNTCLSSPGTIQSVFKTEAGQMEYALYDVSPAKQRDQKQTVDYSFSSCDSVLRIYELVPLSAISNQESLTNWIQARLQEQILEHHDIVFCHWQLVGEESFDDGQFDDGQFLESLQQVKGRAALLERLKQQWDRFVKTSVKTSHKADGNTDGKANWTKKIRHSFSFGDSWLDEGESLESLFSESLSTVSQRFSKSQGGKLIPENIKTLLEKNEFSAKRLAERIDWRHIQGTAKRLGAHWLGDGVYRDDILREERANEERVKEDKA